MRDGFIKVALCTPEVRCGDTKFNVSQILEHIFKADRSGAKLIVFPELAISGASCGDLFYQRQLQDAVIEGLAEILTETSLVEGVIILGLPLMTESGLCNCAAVLQKGKILEIIVKNQARGIFSPFPYGVRIQISLRLGQDRDVVAPISSEGLGLFSCINMPELSFAISIGGCGIYEYRATVFIEITAERALAYNIEPQRTQMLGAELGCCYLKCAASSSESTTDYVCSGESIIAEPGEILCSSVANNFSQQKTMLLSVIDVQKAFALQQKGGYTQAQHNRHCIDRFDLPITETKLNRRFDKSPFLPTGSKESSQCKRGVEIQAIGLVKRLKHACFERVLIGVSGGLDSTLALLVAARAFDILGLPREQIVAVSMPCFGTTERTRSNAQTLSEELGVDFRVINIGESVLRHFKDIGQDENKYDVTFENAQARERTQVLMDLASKERALVVGTGDLSESALGFSTYNGDHMSMYNVNCGVPKTMVRKFTFYVAQESEGTLKTVLMDILNTPISPELLPPEDGGDSITQETESLVGPYILHDFFIYYFLRYGFSPRKILRMAESAFSKEYDRETIRKWLKLFLKRFFMQQFKRSCSPDGPQVFPITLSPRGGFSMPSDMSSADWLNEI